MKMKPLFCDMVAESYFNYQVVDKFLNTHISLAVCD